MKRFAHNTGDALANLATARTSTSDHATVAQLMVATNTSLTTQLEIKIKEIEKQKEMFTTQPPHHPWSDHSDRFTLNKNDCKDTWAYCIANNHVYQRILQLSCWRPQNKLEAT
jgi:hypothetical protein